MITTIHFRHLYDRYLMGEVSAAAIAEHVPTLLDAIDLQDAALELAETTLRKHVADMERLATMARKSA